MALHFIQTKCIKFLVNNTNRCTEFQFKIGIQWIYWFYSQGIYYDVWSYDLKIQLY